MLMKKCHDRVAFPMETPFGKRNGAIVHSLACRWDLLSTFLLHSCTLSLGESRKSGKSGKKENQWQPDRDRVIKRSHSELLMKVVVLGEIWLGDLGGKWVGKRGGVGYTLRATAHIVAERDGRCKTRGVREKDRFEALITWSLIALIIFHFALSTPHPRSAHHPAGFQFPSISIFASFAFRLFLVSRFSILLSCFIRLGIFNLQPVIPKGEKCNEKIGKYMRHRGKRKCRKGDFSSVPFHCISLFLLGITFSMLFPCRKIFDYRSISFLSFRFT